MKRVLFALALALTVVGYIDPAGPVAAQAINFPGSFSKLSPADGSPISSVSNSNPLTWGTSAGATSYEYCADSINNNQCDGGWTNVGNNTAVVPLFIAYSDFWWQVRARNALGTTEASGPWWRLRSFSTPQPFSKLSPANGAAGLSTDLILGWFPSAGVTDYQYCIDAVLNNVCDGGWLSKGGPFIGAIVEGLAPGTTYEWQVRAMNANGFTVADGGAWWRLTTRPLPPGTYFFDDLESFGGIGWIRESNNNNDIWRVTDESVHSPTEAWSDSFNGPYEPNLDVWIESPEIRLIGAKNPVLTFWQQYDFAPDGFDRGTIYVSANGGAYTFFTSFSGSDPTWRQVTLDFTRYAGATVRIMFNLQSNATQEGDGWYIDDVVIAEPTPPGSFSKIGPASGSAGVATAAELGWTTSSGATSYEYCVDVINNNICDGGWVSTGPSTTVTVNLVGNTAYYWQVRGVNSAGTAMADSGTWWAFTTVGAPFVITHPQSQSAAAGQSATLTVAAGGASPLIYQWYAGSSGNISVPVAGQTTATFVTPPVTATTRYWVRVSNLFGTADSTAATVSVRFTDDPLVPGVTTVRAVHVSELRGRIDALRVRFGLLPFGWTDTVLAGARIRAQHVLDLRAALAEVYARAQVTSPTYTDPGLTGGVTAIRAAHLQEIRAAVVGLE